MKETLVKYISISAISLGLIISLSVFVSNFSGCVHFPELDDMTIDCPASCIDYQRCLYYNAKSKTKIDCSAIYDRCSKDRVWHDCSQKKLPDNTSFQECWDKKR
jgi:hypothetical protein